MKGTTARSLYGRSNTGHNTVKEQYEKSQKEMTIQKLMIMDSALFITSLLHWFSSWLQLLLYRSGCGYGVITLLLVGLVGDLPSSTSTMDQTQIVANVLHSGNPSSNFGLYGPLDCLQQASYQPTSNQSLAPLPWLSELPFAPSLLSPKKRFQHPKCKRGPIVIKKSEKLWHIVNP